MEIICLKNEDGSEIDSEEEQSTFDIESLGNNLLPKYIRVFFNGFEALTNLANKPIILEY